MRDEIITAYDDAKSKLDEVHRSRFLTYGPEAAKVLITLFDAIGLEIDDVERRGNTKSN